MPMYAKNSGRPAKCPTRPNSTSKADREVPKEAKDVICLRHLKRLKLLFSLTVVPTGNTLRLHVVFQSSLSVKLTIIWKSEI